MTQQLVDVGQISENFRGPVLRPGDPDYEDACHVFNGMFWNRRPAVIARCTGVADVMAAIAFARESGLEIAVRGGGHSVAGHSSTDGGIVIDLSPMKGIRVDPDAKTASAQGGVTWGEFDRETQAFGLATTGGRVTTTGIAGLTLGSGSGWAERKFGLAFDNLLSCDLVTADGRLVTASPTQNEDLFWGLCGAGGNFGIVTSFEYRLHALGPIVLAGMLLHRRDKAGELLRAWRDVMEDAPDELCSGFAFLTAPPEPFVPEDLQLQPAIGVVALYAGPAEEGEAVIDRLRKLGTPAADIVGPMPYTFFQTLLDGPNPPGRHNYWKSENVGEMSDAAIEVLVDGANAITSPFSFLVIEPKGGAIAKRAEDETALGNRDAVATFYGIAQWEDPSQADEQIAWTRDLAVRMEPFTTGRVALNFVSETDTPRVRATFGDKYDRLVELKRKYDPDNVFRLNANIKP